MAKKNGGECGKCGAKIPCGKCTFDTPLAKLATANMKKFFADPNNPISKELKAYHKEVPWAKKFLEKWKKEDEKRLKEFRKMWQAKQKKLEKKAKADGSYGKCEKCGTTIPCRECNPKELVNHINSLKTPKAVLEEIKKESKEFYRENPKLVKLLKDQKEKEDQQLKQKKNPQ